MVYDLLIVYLHFLHYCAFGNSHIDHFTALLNHLLKGDCNPDDLNVLYERS